MPPASARPDDTKRLVAAHAARRCVGTAAPSSRWFWASVILYRSGQVHASAQALACSEALLDEVGAGDSYWVRRENRGTVAHIRETLDGDAFAEAWEQGRALTLDEAIAFALDSLAQPS